MDGVTLLGISIIAIIPLGPVDNPVERVHCLGSGVAAFVDEDLEHDFVTDHKVSVVLPHLERLLAVQDGIGVLKVDLQHVSRHSAASQ
jgi:hypothetical protein